MLLAQNITLHRSNQKIFENINLSLGLSKIVILKGKNGSGKTSFLKTILFILEPSSGTIYWKGKLLKNDLYSFYSNVTYISDKFTSLRDLSVIENISIWKKFFLSKIDNSQINNILETLSLSDHKHKKVSSLSFGETKKLELFRLVIEQKKIWILDEPFSNLDTQSIEILSQTFEDHLNNEGSILFSSHQDINININEEIIL